MKNQSQSERFRAHHLFTILDSYDLTKGSLDFFVTSYFRAHPQLGSKDRAYVSCHVFRYMRMKSLFDWLLNKRERDSHLLEFLEETNEELIKRSKQAPEEVHLSCPKALLDIVKQSWPKRYSEILYANFDEAPTYLRANPLRTTPEELLSWLKEKGVEAARVEGEEFALRLAKRTNLFSLPIFQEGWFEVQDAASQHVALLVDPKPNHWVFDYCAGSGGKTLGFAYKMAGQGQIYLHDIRNEALLEARKRLKRAGIQNAQCIRNEEEKKLEFLRGRFDWVLVDAPCTGTGTLRRNPDMKWRFSEEMLFRLVHEQRTIFEKALSYLKPNGRIVYATCSVLKEENQDQVDFFEKTFHLERVGHAFQSVPTKGGMDGLFGVILRKKLPVAL